MNTNIDATIAAIAILRALDRWNQADSIGQTILCRAWRRLESEAHAYLTGK